MFYGLLKFKNNFVTLSINREFYHKNIYDLRLIKIIIFNKYHYYIRDKNIK